MTRRLHQIMMGSNTGSEVGGSSNVTWTGTQNADTSSPPDLIHSKAGYSMYANSVQSINSGSASPTRFSMVGASSTASGWLAELKIYLMAASGAPYTTPTGYKVRFGFDTTGAGSVFKDGAYVADFPSSVALNDVITVGFDGSGHLQIRKNGTPLWTDGSVTDTADYILFVTADNETTTIRLDDVTYE